MEVTTPAEQLLLTTVRIETECSDASRGCGTGFVFGYEADDKNYPFIVTNRHVTADATHIWLYLLKQDQGKPVFGKAKRFESSVAGQFWYVHPDPSIDIAILPLGPAIHALEESGHPVFYLSVPSSLVLSPQQLSNLDALEEVVFIGYPNGIWDTHSLLPVMRRGITATPITMDFRGIPQFLIDASVFRGSSGSPVFLYNRGTWADRKGAAMLGSRLAFLGIVASAYYDVDIGRLEIAPAPTANTLVPVTKQMINLGVVFKASVIVDFIRSWLVAGGHIPAEPLTPQG